MLGAIAGDVIGSVYEFHPAKSRDFPLFTAKSEFTDDTVMTLAVARSILDADKSISSFEAALIRNFKIFGRRYPDAGYGGKFFTWIFSENQKPYNSYGNGSAMRVSPIAWAFDSLVDVEEKAAASASVTHNHPEGIKGAQAIAGSIFLARKGHSKEDIKKYNEEKYNYDLDRALASIQPGYTFSEICQTSVPEAIIAFLESTSFEDAIRNAIWLGGDADTQADMAGAIAEAFYGGVPARIADETIARLDPFLKDVLQQWNNRYAA